jgi:hypothetical protein
LSLPAARVRESDPQSFKPQMLIALTSGSCRCGQGQALPLQFFSRNQSCTRLRKLAETVKISADFAEKVES